MVIFLLNSGMTFSFGVIMTDMVDDMGVEEVALVGSLMQGFIRIPGDLWEIGSK